MYTKLLISTGTRYKQRGRETMSHSSMTRYLIAIPCLVVFILILVLSSNARGDTGEGPSAAQFSHIDTSSSMVQADADDASEVAGDAFLDGVSSAVISSSERTLQVQGQDYSRDHISIVDAMEDNDRFTHLDVGLFDFERADLTIGSDSIWSKAMLVKEEPGNDTGVDPWIEDNNEWEESNQENGPMVEYRPPQWYLDEAVRIFMHYQREMPAIDEPVVDAEIILDQKVQADRTMPGFRKENVAGGQPNDRPPNFAKGVTHEKGMDIQSQENDRIVLVDPVPKLPLPLFSRIANPMANGSIRGEILEFIRANPGEHMSKIKRKFNLSTSSAVHHLSILEKNGIIIAHKDGKFKRYFANENGYRSTIDGEYKAIFSVLKNSNSKQIAMHLIANPHSTLSEVSMVTGLNPSTVHWHAERMEDVKIISKSRDGKNVRYFIENTETVEKVIALLNT